MEYPLTRNFLHQMKRDELRERCRLLNYRVTGFKSDLAERVLIGDHCPKAVGTSRPRPRLIKPILDEMTSDVMDGSISIDRRQEGNTNHYWIPVSLIVATIFFSCSL